MPRANHALSAVMAREEPWTSIPLKALFAELARRQVEGERPVCGSEGRHGTYNTPLHVFALFLILIASILACSFPLIVRHFPRLPVPHHFLFISRHFGTGVLIATGFVHLLPTAFVSLTDPCLPPFWNQHYPAMAGFIAMTSVLVVVGIEMFFASSGAGHVHGGDYIHLPEDAPYKGRTVSTEDGLASRDRNANGDLRHPPQLDTNMSSTDDQVALQNLSPSHEGLDQGLGLNLTLTPRNPGFQKYRDEDGASDLDIEELNSNGDGAALLGKQRAADGGGSQHVDTSDFERYQPLNRTTAQLSEEQEQRRMLLQCMLLEAGILFHSVFIGMALSVATGTPFIVLLVAITFHQTFEGLALGSRIAAIKTFTPTSVKPWLMCIAYGTTTPLGQAIGLLVHNLYDPASETGLLMVGIMNAISSGLLLFAGLVELLAEDFLSEKSYDTLKGRRRLEACISVVGGAMLMAFVGAFA